MVYIDSISIISNFLQGYVLLEEEITLIMINLQKVEEFTEYLLTLTDEERVEVLFDLHSKNFCQYCGKITDKICHCMNDE